MIYFLTGVPGSGKSYHLALIIKKALENGQNVISNFDVNTDLIKNKGNFVYVKNDELRSNTIRNPKKGEFSSILGLINFARNFHKSEIKNNELFYPEHQTLFVLDECHVLFDSRKWNSSDRSAWVEFLAEHRKLGFDIALTSQDDKSIDKQIRARLENELYHRKFLNFIPEFLALPIRKIFKHEIFICVTRKYGMISKQQAHYKTEYILSKQLIYDFYNTSHIFLNLDRDFIGASSSPEEVKESVLYSSLPLSAALPYNYRKEKYLYFS